MNKHYFLIAFLLSACVGSLQAQIGGRYAFSFLEKPVSSRVAALGGNTAAINDNDINLGFVNPSLINTKMHHALSLAYVDFFSDINYGFAQYGHHFDKLGSFVGTLQYFHYGTFDYADVGGNTGGTFTASDMALTVGWGRRLSNLFTIGAAFKMIYSANESYNAFGMAVDVAGSYQSETGWDMSLIARNVGIQLTTYTPGERDPLPFNLQYTVSKRLEHVPFRFSMIYDHLEKWNLAYDDPTNPNGIDPETGELQYNTGFGAFADNMMRHIIIGGEIYIGKNLILRGGYNYRRRQELKMNDKLAMVGFSWGFGVRIYKFKINYSRATYHLNGSPNYLTLTFDLDSFMKKN